MSPSRWSGCGCSAHICTMARSRHCGTLLSPSGQRPRVFYRGYDVVDIENIGFISTGPEAAARGFRIDTALRGNSNTGHQYGTDLNEPDKRALLEYLKTL